MATATMSEGSFRSVEPLGPAQPTDMEISDTPEPGPSSPTSPMSDSMRPTSPEALLSEEEDMDGLDDARKKKRFRPFKSIRKLFKRKRLSKSDDDVDDGKQRSKSTGELNLSDTDERMFDPKPSSATMSSSRSESSVFVPEQPTLLGSESSKSTEHISKDFTKDLSAMLARRKSPDEGAVAHTSEDDVTKATKEETTQEEDEPRKEKSFDDTDKSMSAAMSSPWAEKRSKYSSRDSKSVGDTAYLDLDAIKTSPNGHLSHLAAKHKMSIKPKTRRATTRGRISSKKNKNEQASHDASLNDSSFSSKLGDSSILSESIEESNTSSLLENQQELSETLPVGEPINEETFSTSQKNPESTKTESSEKEGNMEGQPKRKWSPPTSPKFALDSTQIASKRKELTSNTEARKPMQKEETNKEIVKVFAAKENTKLSNLNEQKDKVETPHKTDQIEPPKPAVIFQIKKDTTNNLPSNSMLTPSELVIRDKPVNMTEKLKKQEQVKITETKMSDDEEEEQPMKSVRDRILLFQNTASRNNSNNSSPNEVRKVQIEVADKNGNNPENVPLKVISPRTNTSAKDSANGNTSYKVLQVKSNSNQGETSQTSSKEEEKNLQNKRTGNKRSFMPKTESCIVCSKAVYMNEMVRSEGKVFHKACQKCTECTRTLQVGNVLLVANKLYCRLHGTEEKMKLLKMRSEVD